MVHYQCVGALFGHEHVVFAQRDANLLRPEQFCDKCSIFQVGARRITKAIPAPSILLLKELLHRRIVFAAEAEFLTHAFVPEFGQALGAFDTEAVQVKIFLIFVPLAEVVGEFGRCVADGDKLHPEYVKLPRIG